MTAKHTPGPWVQIALMVSEANWPTGRGHDICHCGVGMRPNAQLPESEANARLIAAAPAMLAMLQRIVSADDAALKDLATLGLDVSAGPAALMTNEIRAVISLATGSAS